MGGVAPDVRSAIEAVWRIESAKLLAGLTRQTRDVSIAEDLASEALVAAFEQWPASGIPDKPGAWLMTTARRRWVDRVRHAEMASGKEGEIAHELAHGLARDADVANEILDGIDDHVGDDLLRLIFMGCHPVLSTEARVALTLRLLGGLATDEIARAFVVPEKTVGQRISRAKRTLTEARVPFEVPRGDAFTERLASVLQVVYLIFNEGYSATSGEDWIRPALCDEALRLGRILATLVPDESEVHGLVALMEIQASRLSARTDRDGEPILLLDQNRARWDRLLIGRGLDALARAERLEGSLGPYAIQASIAACHARARVAGDTDWVRIAALYDALAELTPSPIVELNRAVALSMAYGAAAALEVVDDLVAAGTLREYHLLPSVRGDLLAKLGRHEEASREFARAAGLTRNARERTLLLRRAGERG